MLFHLFGNASYVTSQVHILLYHILGIDGQFYEDNQNILSKNVAPICIKTLIHCNVIQIYGRMITLSFLVICC